MLSSMRVATTAGRLLAMTGGRVDVDVLARVPLDNSSVGDHPKMLATRFVHVRGAVNAPAFDALWRGGGAHNCAARADGGVPGAAQSISDEKLADVLGLHAEGYPPREGIERA